MDDIQAILTEIQERLPAFSAWSYIAIWAFSEMVQRTQNDPDNPRFIDIMFPHTSIPLFTEKQAAELESAWKTHVQPTLIQSGGAVPFPPTLSDVKKASTAAGQVLGTAVAGVDGEDFSIDKQYEYVTKTLDSLDAQLTSLSKQYGVVALESVAPDPRFVIPLGPVPIPISIPVRIILPTLNVLLEAFRVLSTMYPSINIFGKPVTYLMMILDLARGNLYHAMFTFLGVFGKYPMYGGILMKVLRDAYLLVSPDIRGELREAIYKTGKSFTAGFMIWTFTVIAPDFVRRPIVTLLDKIRTMAETYNESRIQAELKATAALKGFGSVELPKLPSEKIPSIGDLYILQEYLHNPRFYCQPDVADLVSEMRAIPPMALFFDVLSIPRKGSEEFERECARIQTSTLIDDLAPKIIPATPSDIDATTELSGNEIRKQEKWNSFDESPLEKSTEIDEGLLEKSNISSKPTDIVQESKIPAKLKKKIE